MNDLIDKLTKDFETYPNMYSDEIFDCCYTIQDTITELIKIENELANRCLLTNDPKIQNSYRVSLFKMNMDEKLPEDELVRNWHERYSSYCNWIEDSPRYAKVYIVRAENEKYNGFTGKIIEVATNDIRLGKYGSWPNMIYYHVKLANGIPMVFSNREIIYL